MTATEATPRPLHAQCRIEVDSGLLFRATGTVIVGKAQCELHHGHVGSHRRGWWKWGGQYAKDPNGSGVAS